MSYDVEQSFEQDGYVIQIVQDPHPDNPLLDDEAIKVVMWHPNYDWGNCHDFATPADFDEFCKANETIRLPMYLYEHSGVTVNTTGFHCPWDSGQVGWAFVTLKDVEEHGLPDPEAALRQAVALLDDFLVGRVWGYLVRKKCECCGALSAEPVASCWGFFGDLDKEAEYIREEALCDIPEPEDS